MSILEKVRGATSRRCVETTLKSKYNSSIIWPEMRRDDFEIQV